MFKLKLIAKRGHKCENCQNSMWFDKPIPLEIHHLETNSEAENNLQLLCPNCHAMTPNYRGKGIRTSKTVSDAEIIESVNKSNNFRQLLINLNLVAKGGNYEVIKKRLKKLNLYDKFKTLVTFHNCLSCGEIISPKMKFCSNSCSNKFNSQNGAAIHKRKIIWPPVEVIEKMVNNFGYSSTGRQLGVSDNAVRKYLKRYLC